MPRAETSAAVVFSMAMLLGGRAVAAEKKTVTAPTYVELPTLTASILRPEGGRGVMTLSAGLDSADASLRERAELSRPRLIDAYSSTLRRYAASLAPAQPPDLEMLGRSLQRDTDKTLGRPGARFLFGAVLVN